MESELRRMQLTLKKPPSAHWFAQEFNGIEFFVVIIANYENGMALYKGGIGPGGVDFLLVLWIVKKGSQVTACKNATENKL